MHYWVVSPSVSGLMGRLDLDDRWWAIVQKVDTRETAPDALALVRSLIGPGDGVQVRVVATDPWIARMLLVDRYNSGRVFLVGDAAHLNPPWGGHGFNTCVGDAVNIGWKLAAVLQGWGGSGLLDSYEPERRPVAAQTIADSSAQEKLLAPSFASLLDSGDVADALQVKVRVLQRRARPRVPLRGVPDRRRRRVAGSAAHARDLCPYGPPRRPASARVAARRNVPL